ncbi:hypothetical protein phiCTP1_gp37 [Clostridium phage phiCTP1]|uniref:hypothetical protein n=1 Tax=Clostridium phage phiCTP1 TaxID=871584 RepID=UPI0001E07833|nr:hypothetical protein phiCTP1_gp37 [Clostridium phage phiCTP1]ADL40338.1 hypothetical phage protein [Clostridium phage phiCTP1]
MAKLKSIRCEYGTSFQTGGPNGVWHKVGCAVELELENNDNSKKVKEMAWNTVVEEIEKQIEDIQKNF